VPEVPSQKGHQQRNTNLLYIYTALGTILFNKDTNFWALSVGSELTLGGYQSCCCIRKHLVRKLLSIRNADRETLLTQRTPQPPARKGTTFSRDLTYQVLPFQLTLITLSKEWLRGTRGVWTMEWDSTRKPQPRRGVHMRQPIGAMELILTAAAAQRGCVQGRCGRHLTQ
jgi:hypothetical protein